jgi:hypothetical protein
MEFKAILMGMCTLACSMHSVAAGTPAAEPVAEEVKSITPPEEKQDEGNLDQFGFAPAFFYIVYDEEVLSDSKDVRLRGDGTISSQGTKHATSVGVEVHYSFALWGKSCCKSDGYTSGTSAHAISPFLGLYDLDDGINGIIIGAMYGFLRGNKEYKERTTLNVGVGWTVHKNRLTLARGLKEGDVPASALTVEDYTEKKDVEGVALMISASIGF